MKIALAELGIALLVAGCGASDAVSIPPPPDAAPVSTGSSSGTTPPGPPSDGGATPAGCGRAEECPSRVCNLATRACAEATCTDGVKNGAETDLDCGGSCAPCDVARACKVPADCVSQACLDKGAGLACQAPSATDGVKNGNETDVDCGGTGNPPCDDGKRCTSRTDCKSDYCPAAGTCAAVSPSDGVQNGAETDVDCGGPGASRCDDGKKCLVDADCKSDVCKDTGPVDGRRCQAPTATDGKKNGAETDVDCGGPTAPKCATGKSFLVGADCVSLGCNYQQKCAAGRSCTAHFGGDTCGLGGAGGVGAEAWEDCCVTANVTPTTGPTIGKAIKLGKYPVTAGRMRVFLDEINYDVRAFVKEARAAGKIPLLPGNPQNRPVLSPQWDLYLPTSFAGSTAAGELSDCSQGDTTTPTGTTCKPNTSQVGIYTAVSRHLGGFIFKGNNQTSTGCFVGSPGTHAFRFPPAQQDGEPPEADQATYDTKSMQCIDYLVGQAFCVWDGGRLELLDEWQAALGAGATPFSAMTTRTPVTPGTNSYWGCRFPWATDANQADCGTPWDAATQTIEFADYKYSYEYPKLGATDYIVFISAPGRTRGRGPGGHSDLLGNVFELTSTVVWNADPQVATHRWSGNGSWEVHTYNKAGGPTTGLLNKYGKLGLRCAYP